MADKPSPDRSTDAATTSTGNARPPDRADVPDTGSPPPPSRYLNEKPQGMVSQADVDDTALDDETIRRQRREDNINPARAREQPPDT